MRNRRAAIVLGLGLVGALFLPAGGARGAFPGTNGRIVFFAGHSPDGGGGEADIYTMRPNGTDMKHLTRALGADTDPAYSPNGKMIVFVNGSGNTVVMNANGKNKDPISMATYDEDFSWINNNRILFIRGPDVWTMKADGSDAAAVVATPDSEEEPDWNKARERIVFTRFDGNDTEVFTMKLNGTDEDQITVNDDYEIDPDWAPGGNRIAFSSNRDGDYEIFSIRPNSTGLRKLTNNSVIDDEEPAHSPDGKLIAFETDSQGSDDEIWKMLVDGSNERRITDNSWDDDNPDWQPLH